MQGERQDVDFPVAEKNDVLKMSTSFSVERKGIQSYQSDIYARFLCFGNGALTALYDHSDGFWRRQLVLTTKDRPANREDNPFLVEALSAELEGILLWCLDGLQRLLRNSYGITGVRGQVEAGLPAVRDYGLPALEAGIAAGYDINRAGCAALLVILAHSTDTNIIARSSRERQLALTAELQALLAADPYPDEAALAALDDRFIAERLSPGGSADLLALTYLLHFFKTEEYLHV